MFGERYGFLLSLAENGVMEVNENKQSGKKKVEI